MTKGMLKTMRNLTESIHSTNVIREQNETENQSLEVDTNQTGNVKDNIIVINNVDVKMLSTDESDMELKEDQKELISKLIDSFRAEVSDLAEFEPGITINQKEIRMDGVLPEERINFVFITSKDMGEQSGVFVNADMLKLEQNTANTLTKLSKFEETFKTQLNGIMNQRDFN